MPVIKCLYPVNTPISNLEMATYHHPCPSRRIPHGNPMLRLQTRRVEQYLMSSPQSPKPPRKILSPRPTINHISLRMALSLYSFANRSDFDISTGFLAEPYFARREGRRLTSMTYMERNSTTAVMIAKAFWWKTGSCR